MTAILEKARADGYSEGYEEGRNRQAQYDQNYRDAAFYEGQQDGWENAPSRFRWWLFGVICGAAIVAWWLS